MTTVPQLRPITAAILGLLGEELDCVGDGQRPDGAGWQGAPGGSLFRPYVVLHPLFGDTDGSIAEPDGDANRLYQVTAVGSTREQAEWAADAARAALVGRVVEVDGRVSMPITVDEISGTRRDDTTQPGEPPMWISTDRFLVMTTPGPELGS